MDDCFKIYNEHEKYPDIEPWYRIKISHPPEAIEGIKVPVENKKALWDKKKGDYFEGWEIVGHIKLHRCKLCGMILLEKGE